MGWRKRRVERLWWALVVVALLLATGACEKDASNGTSAGAAASINSGLTGTWVTVPGYDDVTLSLEEDGTFAWDNRSLGAFGKTSGTWTADATTLTFTFAEDGIFCVGETLTWEYHLEGRTLASVGIASTCPEPPGGPPESWEFERQPDA